MKLSFITTLNGSLITMIFLTSTDFNIYNVIGYYEIDDLYGLHTCFNAPYDDDESMDLKIELIHNIIRLVLE